MANDDDKHPCFNPFSWIFAYLIFLGVNIAMVVVGWQYSESCTIEIVPKFLKIGGGVMLGLTGLYFICGLLFCVVAKLIALLGLFIWACSPIFNAYGNWHYHYYVHLERNTNSYCEYGPFMLAFVVLIMYGVVLGIISAGICFLCYFCCLVCSPDNEEENTTPELNATALRRVLSTTSQKANAYLPPSDGEVAPTTYRNFQGRLQRLSSIDVGNRPSSDRSSYSINLPTTENSQQPSTTEDYSLEVRLNMVDNMVDYK